MPRTSSTRSAPAKRKNVRRSAAIENSRQNAGGILSTEEHISEYVELTRGLVLAAWPKIVRGLIKKAASGGYQQTKLLLDICNLNEPHMPPLNNKQQLQLCDVLLEGLELVPGLQEISHNTAQTDLEAGL